MYRQFSLGRFTSAVFTVIFMHLYIKHEVMDMDRIQVDLKSKYYLVTTVRFRRGRKFVVLVVGGRAAS